MRLKWRDTEYRDLLWKSATTTTLSHYAIEMEEFRKYDTLAHEWLNKIPSKTWSIAHFSGRAKIDGLTNNLCEVFNSKLFDVRDKPIITCLEYREYLMKRIVIVQKEIDKFKGKIRLTPTTTYLLAKIRRDASQNTCIFNGAYKSQFTTPAKDQYVVDFKNKTCTCRYWEVIGIVCNHVVSVIWDKVNHGEKNVPDIGSWVYPIYWLETWESMYSHKVDLINRRTMWPKSTAPTTITVPKHHTQVGRPKKQRKRAASEVVHSRKNLSKKFLTMTCSKCGHKGRNQRSCKGQGGETNVSKVQNKRQKPVGIVIGKQAEKEVGKQAENEVGKQVGKK